MGNERDIQGLASKVKRPWKKLSEEDRKFLEQNFPFLTDEELGTVLGRSPTTIRKHRQLLGLNREKLDMTKVSSGVPIVIWIPEDCN